MTDNLEQKVLAKAQSWLDGVAVSKGNSVVVAKYGS